MRKTPGGGWISFKNGEAIGTLPICVLAGVKVFNRALMAGTLIWLVASYPQYFQTGFALLAKFLA